MGHNSMRKKYQKKFEKSFEKSMVGVGKPLAQYLPKRPTCSHHGIPYSEKHSKASPAEGGWRILFCKKCRRDASGGITLAPPEGGTKVPRYSWSDYCEEMGEMLKETERNVGAKGSKVTGNKREPVKDAQPTLSDLRLTKRESAEAQMLASLTEEKQVKGK